MPRPVVIDCDPGLDDAMALLLAIRAAKEGVWDLVAITIVDGNSNVDNGCTNALRVLELTNFKTGVYRGYSSSMVLQHEVNSPLETPFHGFDGFGDMEYPQPKDMTPFNKDIHAVDVLIQLSRQYEGELTVIALGPLTNIAMAMNIDEHFICRVKELHVMGGNFKGVGNTSSSAEFNFYKDTEAAYVVLDRVQCPMYLTTWELCFFHANQPLDWRKETLGKIDSAEAKMMNYIEHKHVFSDQPIRELMKTYGYIMCDQIAVAIALKPDIIKRSSRCHASVELNGRETRGQVVIDHRRLKQKEDNVTIVEELDIPQLQTIMQWALRCPNTDLQL